MEWLDTEIIGHVLGNAFASDVAKWLFTFSVAAWIHSGRVNKAIAANFRVLSESINSLTAAIREELMSHAREDEKAFKELNEKITRLERVLGDEWDQRLV